MTERLHPADLRAALELLLAPPGGSREAGRQFVPDFCEYLADSATAWEGWREGPLSTPRALVLLLLPPGRTALLMVPSPGENGTDPDAQSRLTETALGYLVHRRLHYAQALLEPEATAKVSLLRRVGFTPLAPLTYLERGATYPWAAPPRPDEAQWLVFDDRTYGEFAQVVLGTYEGSLDCPELAGLRPIDDILASHRATGHFDPALWELALIGRQPAACLLLSRLPRVPALEIVYMGVLPAWRGRGIGKLLLRRALERCRITGARRLNVVVDGRNTPAKRLYDGFGFKPVARRDAYMYRWSCTGAAVSG